MTSDKAQPLRFPLDKAGYIGAVLQQHRRLMASTGAKANDGLSLSVQQQVDFYNQLITVTEAVSRGELSYDRLQFYDNGEVRILMPAPTPEVPHV